MATSEPSFVLLPLMSPLRVQPPVHHRHFGSDERAESSRSPAAKSSYPPPSLLTASYSQAGRFPSPNSTPTPDSSRQFQYVSEKQQSRILSPHPTRKPSFLTRGLASLTTPRDGISGSPYPFSRMYAAVRSATPTGGGRGSASWRREESGYGEDGKLLRKNSEDAKCKDEWYWALLARILRPGSRPSKRLLVLIVLNLAYSVTEFLIGVLTRRIGGHSSSYFLCIEYHTALASFYI